MSRFLAILLMNDNVGKAFDLAQDSSKQLLTLASGIVVVTITFFDDFGRHAPFLAKVMLGIGWLGYLISVLAGIFTLQTLAGNLQSADLDIYANNTKIFSITQIITFLLALLLTVVAGGLTWL
jgi:hypothetical protein